MAGLVVTLNKRGIAKTLSGLVPTKVGMLVREGTLAFDNSYPTNGEPLVAADLGLDSIDVLIAGPYLGRFFEFDYAANKLKVLIGDWNNAADGPLIDTANAADLSALVAVPFFAIGRATTLTHELP